MADTEITHIQTGPHRHNDRGARWLLLLRLIVLALAICVLLISAAGRETFPSIPGNLFAIIGGVAVLNVIYMLLLPRVRNIDRFIFIQIAVDIIAESLIVFLTRGVDSNFVYLYFASIMGGSIMLSRRDSSILACLATVGLAVVTTLHLTGTGSEYIHESYRMEWVVLWPAMARMLSIVTAFFLVAYLSALLRSRLVLAQILNEEILQNMPEGVVVFDREERAIFLNAEFIRLFSRDNRVPQVGDSIEHLFRGEYMEGLRKALRQGRHWRFELEDRPEEGADRPPLEIRVSPVGEGETVRGLIAIFVDLSWRKQVEQAERRADRFEAVGEMAAGLAHEIRNPLASVRGSMQEICDSFAGDSSERTLCDIVMKASDRLDLIITDFLSFARARPLRLGMCRLQPLLQETKSLLERNPVCGEVEIMLNCDDNEATVRADSEQIKGVFLNLGLNALKAMQGKGRLAINLRPSTRPQKGTGRYEKDEQGMLVTFADTGPGLAPGTEERIFEPFYTTRSDGTGLGLAIAQRTIQGHHGFIWVESTHGEGANFMIWLPSHGPHLPPNVREGTGIFVRRKTEA